MRAYRADASVVHDHDLVGVHDRAHALRDHDLGRGGQVLGKAALDLGVGLGVDGARGVIEYEHARLGHECAGDAQALLLPARDVGAALLDHGLVTVRQLVDKLVRAGELAGAHQLCIVGLGVTPAQVLGDGAAKELVFLQYHGHLAAQRIEVVVAHIDAAHAHGARGDVIETGDEVHKARLGRTRAADDAHDLAALDGEVYVLEYVFLGLARVGKAHVVKLHGTVRNLRDGATGLGARDVALFVE